jgi:hypothetical protein
VTHVGGQNRPENLSAAGFRDLGSDVNFSLTPAKFVRPVWVLQQALFWHLLLSGFRNKPHQNQPVAVTGAEGWGKSDDYVGVQLRYPVSLQSVIHGVHEEQDRLLLFFVKQMES